MTLETNLDTPQITSPGEVTSAKLAAESANLLSTPQQMQTEDGSSRNPDAHHTLGSKLDRTPTSFKPTDDPNSKWVIPDLSKGEMPRFGLKGGMQFGFYPGSLNPNTDGGPRGLIRVWTPSMPDNSYCLSNFIAVEPTAVGNPEKGFSELEASQGSGDWKPGKLMTVDPNSIKVTEVAPGVEELSLTCDVERFHNGTHMQLEISQRSDDPDELHFKVRTAADSAAVESCILTATWGNLTRSREIWLKDGMVNSLEIPSYRQYKGYDFSPDQYYFKDKLVPLPNGAVGAAMTTNETHPNSIHPVFNSGAWYWGAKPITQYWEAIDPDPNIHLRVNGRFKYWNSKWAQADGVEVTGGTTFENFEMRQKYHPGQEYVFGVSTKKPEDLGFAPKRS